MLLALLRVLRSGGGAVVRVRHTNGGGCAAESSVTQHVVGARDQLAFVMTFFLSDAHFEAERDLYSMPALRGIVPRCEIFTDDTALCGPHGDVLPPCMVFERGETLAEWRRRRSPERQILAEVRPPLCWSHSRAREVDAGIAVDYRAVACGESPVRPLPAQLPRRHQPARVGCRFSPTWRCA